MIFTMKVPYAYDLLSSIHSWIFPDIQPVPEITSRDTLSRILTINGSIVPVSLVQEKPGSPLELETLANGISIQKIEEKVNHILNFDLYLDEVFKAMKNDAALEVIAQRLRGIRPYSSDTIFEGLMKSIIQQQISYRAANVITKRIVIGLSNNQTEHSSFYSFPTPSQFVEAGPEKLRSFGLGYKTGYINDLCSMIVREELAIEQLRNLPYDEVYEILIPIRGIGEWTIQALSIAGLGIFNTFPFGDLAIQNVLGNLYNFGNRVSKKQVIDFASAKGREGPMILYMLMCADALGFFKQ